jgi:DTW domain-containing protein YfiP
MLVDTPRSVCRACSRPQSVCLCAFISPLATRSRVVILQHPRESGVPVGTARLVEQQLESAVLHVGIDLGRFEAAQPLLSDPAAPAILLYPGEGACELESEAPSGPVTLWVLDGTWWQAKKLLKQSPELARLPRYALAPRAPSRYRIRREPAPHCVSTIEAVARALSILEGPSFDAGRFLAPFEALVSQQLEFAASRRARRHIKRACAPRPSRSLAPLSSRSADVVVAYGETNAWPRDSALGDGSEIVHWAAERLGTGERFEAWIAPRRPVAPSFAHHTGIALERVLAGESFAAFHARWQRFVRDGDLLLSWGTFATARLCSEAVRLPPQLDLRVLARRVLRRRTGDVVQCANLLGGLLAPAWADGRTGIRLAAALAVARALAQRAAETAGVQADVPSLRGSCHDSAS